MSEGRGAGAEVVGGSAVCVEGHEQSCITVGDVVGEGNCRLLKVSAVIILKLIIRLPL